MLVNAVDRRYREVCTVEGKTVCHQTASGSRQRVASLPQSFHTPTVFLDAVGEYLVVTGSARVRETAYLYESATALASNDPAASYEGAYSPRIESAMPYKHARTSETGFVWGEYHLDRGTDSILVDQVRVFRASSANGSSIEPVLTLSTDGKPKNLHVHSVDHDPHDPWTMYLTMGDPAPNPQFFRSTDYGRTWQAVSGAGDDQRFRTLRINFGPPLPRLGD